MSGISDYLTHYFKDKTPCEYICIYTRQREHGYFRDVNDAIKFATVKNKTLDVYYGLSTFTSDPKNNTRQQDNVHTPFHYCVIDFDFKDQAHLQESDPKKLFQLLRKALYLRHRSAIDYVVRTGAGLHAYFKCDSYTTAMELRASMQEKYNDTAIIGQPVIDPKPAKASNAVMRIPGSYHHKAGVQGGFKFVGETEIITNVDDVKGCRKAAEIIPSKTRKLPAHVVLNRHVASKTYTQHMRETFSAPYDGLLETCAALRAFEDDPDQGGHHDNLCYIQAIKHARGIDPYEHGIKIYRKSTQYTDDNYFDSQYNSIDRLFNCREGWQASAYNQHCDSCKYRDAGSNPIAAANADVASGKYVPPKPPPPTTTAAGPVEPEVISIPNKNNPLQWFVIDGPHIFICTADERLILATAPSDIGFYYEYSFAPANQVEHWAHVVFRVRKEVWQVPIPAGSVSGITQMQIHFDICRTTIESVVGKGKFRKQPFKNACRDFLESARTVTQLELTSNIGWQKDDKFAGPWGVIDTSGELHDVIIPDVQLAHQHGDINQADLWWDAITPYLFEVRDMWPHTQMLLHAFSAPLLRLFPYSQTVMSLYGMGNLGKTRTLNICKSIWGEYESINAADTLNAAFYTLSTTYDMFSAMDDYKSNISNNQKFYNNSGVDAAALIHRFTDGAGRRRLHRSGRKLIDVDRFRGALGVTSNLSLKQDFHTQRGATGAEAASKRVVELEVHDVGKSFVNNDIVNRGDAAIHAARSYSGAAGVEFMKYITANHGAVENLVAQAAHKLSQLSAVAGRERFYTSFYLSILCTRKILQHLGRIDKSNPVARLAAPKTSRIDRHIEFQMRHTKQSAMHTLPPMDFILGQRALSIYPQVNSADNLQGWTLINSRSFQNQMTAAHAIYIVRKQQPSHDPVIASVAKQHNLKHGWPRRPFNLQQYEGKSSYIAMFTKDALTRICKEENLSDISLLIKHWKLKTCTLALNQALPDHHDMPTYKGLIYWTQQR